MNRNEKTDTQAVESIATQCIDCGICVKQCNFLQEYGSPLDFAEKWQQGIEQYKTAPFHCSLCRLCTAVCPKNLDPAAMFLAMRRLSVASGTGIFEQHKTILNYEGKGRSRFFSWFHIPDGCDTVFFPGCALPGSRPDTVLQLFLLLQQYMPKVGVVLDCCTKPSHDLGRMESFQKYFSQVCQILQAKGVSRVLAACPNCYRIFKEYGNGLASETVYEWLDHTDWQSIPMNVPVTVHDPCGVRFDEKVHNAVRSQLVKSGIQVSEMAHSRSKTFCCGEGGSSGFLRPDLARAWTDKRVGEAGSDRVVSYCAGCVQFLGKNTQVDHLLDVLLQPEQTMAGKTKSAKAPFTYWNRYRLKRKLQKKFAGKGCQGSRQDLLEVM